MKKVSLTDDELDLLIIGLHCVNRSNYNNYGRYYDSYDKVSQMKEELRIKLKRALYSF
jgi:hypothetical protein